MYFENIMGQTYWHYKIMNAQGFWKNRLDQYAIVKSIGKGAFGEVFLAHHKNSGLPVAVKCVGKAKVMASFASVG